jgi:hypothetical protein
MEGVVLCIAAMLACFIAGRRSLGWGLGVVMTIGYGYGIARANLPNPMMFFVFDAGAVGLYAALVTRGLNPGQRERVAVVMPWLVVLIGWPLLLFLFPVQDPLIQLVGLRAQIFFVPFVLIGAMLELDDWYFLANWFAVLNVVAFAFAAGEYVLGIQRFYPINAMTMIIYTSKDVVGHSAYRIPATFINSAAYCGMMVSTMVLLLGAWVQRRGRKLDFWLLSAAIVASVLGVFMGASRSQTLILFAMLGLMFLMGRLSAKIVLRAAVVVAIVGWIVASNPRLQRFTSLGDTDYVEARLDYSYRIGESFVDAAIKYPMGNGLGGGGTSVPYFLRDRLRDPVGMENEYARIMLEQGIPGLLVWLAFIVWVMVSPLEKRKNPWRVGLRLARIYLLIAFAAGVTGTGMLNSTPETAVLLILVGWVSTARFALAVEKTAAPNRVARTRLAGNMM